MRLNLEVSKDQMSSLKALQERAGATTMKDLVNNAMSMLEWAISEAESGNEIAAINERTDTYRVLVTPLLQHVAKHNQRVIAAAV